MSDINLPGLIVPVEARIDKLERSLKRAAEMQARTAGTMEKRAKQSADAMGKAYEGIGAKMTSAFKGLAVPFASGLAGGIAGGLISSTLGAVSTDIRGLIGDIGDLNDAADRLGVTTEELQGLQYGFKLAGVDAADTTSALEKFVDGIGQAAQGTGTLKATLDRAGISLRDQEGNLKDTGTLLRQYADLVDRTPDPAAKMALITDAFGRGGKGMVLALEGGGAALDDMITKAKEAGAVLDAGLVAEAAALDDKFDRLTAKVKVFFESVVVHAAEAVGAVQNLNGNLPNLDTGRGGQAGNLLTPPVADALNPNPDATAAAKDQLAEVTTAYDDLTYSVTQATSAMSGELSYLNEIGDTGAATTLADITGEMDSLTGQMQAGEIPAQTYSEKMTDLAARAKAALEEAQKINGVDMSDALREVDSITSALGRVFAAAQAAVNKMGELAKVQPGQLVSNPGDMVMTDPRVNIPAGNLPRNDLAPTSSRRPPQRGVDDFPDLTPPAKRSGGGGGGDEFARRVTDIQNETRQLEMEATALIATAAAGRQYGDAVTFAREKAQLLNVAQREGKQITPELTAQIEKLAQAHITAGMKVDEAAEKLRHMQTASKNAAETLSQMFVGILSGSMSAGDALKQLLLQIAQVQLQKQITGLFAGTGEGSFLGWLGGMMGYDAGGYTGDGGTLEPAGVVHRGEFVLSKRAVQRIGLPALEDLHQTALKGYGGGGLVGGAGTMVKAARTYEESRQGAGQVVNISAPVTVNGSAGTPQQNSDLAAKIAREMEGTMRKVVQSEIIRQARPGNMLSRGVVAG